jgi:excisionase family DNA binding protein
MPEQAVYTVQDICRISPLSKHTVRRLIHEGHLKARKIGRQYLIQRSDLEVLFPDAFRNASDPRISPVEKQ